MNVRLTSSEKDNHGCVRVFFANENTDDWYYTHGTQALGSPDDDMSQYTMWGWINHMRQKNWWTPQLEDKFRAEAEKYF